MSCASIAVLLSLLADVDAESPAILERVTALAHQSVPAQVSFERETGYISIVGQFDAGFAPLDARLPDSSDVQAATIDFLTRMTGTVPSLRLSSTRPIDGSRDVFEFEVFSAPGVRILDNTLIVILRTDGALEALNGVLVASKRAAEPVLSEEDIRQVLVSLGVDSAIVETEFRAGPNTSWLETQAGLRLDYGWMSEFQQTAWRFVDPENTIILSELGLLLDIRPNRLGITGPCSVRRRSWVRASGITTSYTESGATETEEITCEAADWFGTCYWQLRREPGGYSHGVGRIQDHDGGEQEVALSCSSSAVPQFVGTQGDFLREQGAFYTQNQMRFYVDQNVWSQVAPATESNVQITLDDDGTDAAASFNPITTDIRCNQDFFDPPFSTINGCSQDILAHEYGHYVSHTYGGFDGTCGTSDHSYSLEETFATNFGLLFAFDDHPGSYSAMHDFADGNARSPHVTSGSADPFAMDCSTKLTQRASGLVFTAAVWELLWNRNCLQDTCTESMTSHGSTIFPSLTREQTIAIIGGALAYAHAGLTRKATFGQVRAMMYNYIHSESPAGTAARFQRVFTHHGLPCSACCSGC